MKYRKIERDTIEAWEYAGGVLCGTESSWVNEAFKDGILIKHDCILYLKTTPLLTESIAYEVVEPGTYIININGCLRQISGYAFERMYEPITREQKVD